MYGTATGILNKLPKFDRPAVGLLSAGNSSPSQFVLQNSGIRRFMEKFCSCARRPDREGYFTVEIGNGTRNGDRDAAEFLFSTGENQSASNIVRNFLNSVFAVVKKSNTQKFEVQNEFHDFDEGNADWNAARDHDLQCRDEAIRIPTLNRAVHGTNVSSRFRHLLPTVALRNQVTEFTRYFTTSSIPATLYRTNDAWLVADALATTLIDLCNCNHEAHELPSSLGLYMACVKCTDAVFRHSGKLESNCPSAASLASSVAKYFLDNKERIPSRALIAREAAKRIAYMLYEALETRKLFLPRFSSEQAQSAKEYNERYVKAAVNE